jgi:radical SAM superfamily enzyme YgiQ (UPF0313 family)
MHGSLLKRHIFPLVIGETLQTLPYLALGMVTANLRHYKGGLLQQGFNIERLALGGVKGHPLDTIYESVADANDPVILLSSYVWNHKLNLSVASRIKELKPGSTIIMGGPEVPRFDGESEKFLQQFPFIDIAVLGEGENSCAEIIESFLSKETPTDSLTLDHVPGIVFSRNGEFVRTTERVREKMVNNFPSPYLTGEFEPWFENFPLAFLETNRGCPYGCTYCDWGSATLEQVTKFSTERVIAEISYLASKRTSQIFIADANFGMLEQDIEIAQALVDSKIKTGYPSRLNTNYAKNGGRRLMAVIKILHEGGLMPSGVIALQTMDDVTLRAIKRDNIKTSSYEKMMEYFASEGIPMSTDLMIGLPGQTRDSLQADLQFCFDWKVSANGNFTSMMPNAPMAEAGYREQYQIVTDAHNIIQSTYTFTAEDMQYMKHLYMAYQFFVRFGVIKYILYYLQVEHELPALRVIRTWMDAAQCGTDAIPLSIQVYNAVLAKEPYSRDWAYLNWGEQLNFLFEDIEVFYAEFFDYLKIAFNVSLSASEREALSTAQQAVMPRLGREYPYKANVPHDVATFVNQIKVAPALKYLHKNYIRLADLQPAFVVAEQGSWQKISYRHTHTAAHANSWELPSTIKL